MKLQAKIGDDIANIEIRKDGEKVFARVDDREYELEASEVEPAVYLLKFIGRVYEVYVSSEKGSEIEVNVKGKTFNVEIIDPKKLRSSRSDHGHGDGRAEIKTAMPGKVVRILVQPNETVEKGEGVIVVEAMKMQNEMKAPKDGIVKDIRVSEGSTVEAGEVLVIIE